MISICTKKNILFVLFTTVFLVGMFVPEYAMAQVNIQGAVNNLTDTGTSIALGVITLAFITGGVLMSFAHPKGTSMITFATIATVVVVLSKAIVLTLQSVVG